MKLRNQCGDRLKLKSQETSGLRAKWAQLRVNWSRPGTPAYAADARTLPKRWRIPRFHCWDLGTFTSLSISHASGTPCVCTRASKVVLFAVRYELFQATSPGPGARPESANAIVYVGRLSLTVSSTETSKIV